MAEKKASKAAAARAEKHPESKSIKWHGLTIPLPDELPETIFLDLAMVQAGENPGSTFGMLLSIIGEEQLLAVKRKLNTEKDVTLEDVVTLVGEVFEAYGTSEGESEASQDS